MKNKNLGKMYFSRQRALLESEKNLTKASENWKQSITKKESRIERLMIFFTAVVFLILLTWGGCSSMQTTESSSYEKPKSSNNMGGGYSSGY